MENIKHPRVRSYGQFCGLSRALDAVGDRWNLLIARDLLVGPMRFNELKTSLHGVATNLLTERLRALEAAGIVERRLGDTGVHYALTPWGTGLREPIEALARWGTPLMMTGRAGDAFEPRWLAVALPGLLRGVTMDPPLDIGFEVEGVLTTVRIDEDGPHATTQPDHRPATTLTATAEVVVGLAAGALTVDQALAAGHLEGDPAVLRRAFSARV
ncbi:transcriptional regulator [Actinorhabdospora filicis]|uniref:Transcriptional regulator n=1 Tax=Actinorhabdospora filicis TaxID=1785913 RepID=A0A9W6SM34_9ACTN|nr:winged helix-turn-helix transcriptional regulator [Actinorhabdospora filicis]GLZ78493.1 transcriptional regulator [Actinorhabdospora filicis]